MTEGRRLARELIAGLLATVILMAVLIWLVDAAPPWRAFRADIERVSDGDTVVVSQGSCRLAGIDAPEVAHGPDRPGQPLGREAREALATLLSAGPAVVLVIKDKDRYGRMVCLVWNDQGTLVNLALVRGGWAEAAYLAGVPFQRAFEQAQARAQAAREGIWGQDRYESPAAFRKRVWTGKYDGR